MGPQVPRQTIETLDAIALQSDPSADPCSWKCGIVGRCPGIGEQMERITIGLCYDNVAHAVLLEKVRRNERQVSKVAPRVF